MKKKVFVLFSFLFIFSIVLFGCGGIRLSGGPTKNDMVYGNGGSAVVKGDYLYFANAFLDYNQIGTGDNVYDDNSSQKIYGIYRTKLSNTGKVVLNEDGIPQNVEILSYNVGGFAYSGLYIFGDYLYYTTPYSKKDMSGETVYGLLRLERVKLDGTGHDILNTYDNYSSSAKYSICYDNGVVYFVVLDSNQSLSILKISGGNKKSYTISDSVKSFVVVEQKDIGYNTTLDELSSYVYYTKEGQDASGNTTTSLCRKKLDDSGEEYIIENNSTETISLVAFKNNRVYYTINNVLYSFKDVREYKVLAPYTSIPLSSSDSSTSTYLSSYQILDDAEGAGLDRGIIAVYYSGSTYTLSIYDGKSTAKTLDILEDNTKKVTILATQDNEFYYQIDEDEALYKCIFELIPSGNSFNLKVIEAKVKIADSFSASVNEVSMIDFDNERIFVYEAVDSSTINYLSMYMINDSYVNESDKIIGQYIGLLK